MNDLRIGYAMCGSFCTFAQSVPQIEKLCFSGASVFPVMSETAYSTDTRFGKAADFIQHIEACTGNRIIHTIAEAEPIGPKKLFDIMVIAPCTGNTLAKLSNGITDTPVTMAAKAHLRNGRPLVIAPATNDGLSASAKNIGFLMNIKNVYFVPFQQDDSDKKPSSLIAHFELIPDTIRKALAGEQIQPVLAPLY